MIPKIIHQTWKSDTLPPILKLLYDENVKLLKKKLMKDSGSLIQS